MYARRALPPGRSLRQRRRERQPIARLGVVRAPERLETMPNQRVVIGGVPIDHLDLAGAVARVDAFIRVGTPHQIVTVNMDFLAIARREPTFRQTLVEADLALADGQPLVWLSHRTESPLPERV